jgi:hypothetical protein
MKREPYGYAHFHQEKGILAVRNPFIEPKTVTVKLDESVGWSCEEACTKTAGAGYLVRTLYPRHEVLSQNAAYGSVLTIPLQGYEATIIQVEPMAQARLLVVGKPFEEVRRTGNQVTFAVMNRPQKLPECQVEGSTLTLSDPKLQEITGRCVIQVPEKTKAAIHILCDVKGPMVPVKCLAKVNGRPAEVRTVCTPAQGDQAHGPHPWTWFEFPVPSGRIEVTVVLGLQSKAKLLHGDFGWWVWAEHPLPRQTLTLEAKGPLPPPEPLPLPIQNDRQRQIIKIASPVSFHFDYRWPVGSSQTVWLDEVGPDEAIQDYGELQVNRSVWQKDMIIAGRKFTRGLGTHANGRLVYQISNRGFKKFKALVGRDEHAGDGRVIFQVWLDGKKLFDSGAMMKTTPAKSVEVDVGGGKTLELRAVDGGDGISGDHANWAEARLQK